MILAGIGDVHGHQAAAIALVEAAARRFGVAVSQALQVGDFEANRDDRDRVGRAPGAQLGDFPRLASGSLALPWPLWFIGGNHEPWTWLDALPAPCKIAPRCRYLGRSGSAPCGDLHLAWLSGIVSPRWSSQERPAAGPGVLWKRATYIAPSDLAPLAQLARIDVLLVHDWPRGLVARGAPSPFPAGGPPPWAVGNALARALVDRLRPRLVLCGHLHVPYRTTLRHADGSTTLVRCLDAVGNGPGAVAIVRIDRDTLTELY